MKKLKRKLQNWMKKQQKTGILVNASGVGKLLQKLNPSKASGPDNLSARILKTVATEIAPALASLYQQSLNERQVPDEFKHAHVSPIFKKGQRFDPGNYRPISLTCILCKVHEHIIASAMMNHFEAQKILTPNQHGFRQRHSTETQLLVTTHDIAKGCSDGRFR